MGSSAVARSAWSQNPGSNGFHGNAFEFLRNTDLDARNYFSPTRGAFRQNQFGGTFGGPIRRDKVFFFTDYQGTRQTQGIDTGTISVPSNADRTGNLSDLVQQPRPVSVGGPYFANLLTQKLGYRRDFGRALLCSRLHVSATAVRLSQRGHSAERVVGSGAADAAIHSRSEHSQRLCHLRPTTRRCATTKAPSAWMRIPAGACCPAYYFIDDFDLDNPYPMAQSGASVPGFDALTTGRAQLIALGDTKTINATKSMTPLQLHARHTPISASRWADAASA